MYLQKPFLLPCSIWTLVFLTSFLHVQAISLFLTSSWPQFPSSVCLLFAPEFTQELHVHPCWPSATVAQLSEHCNAPFLCSEAAALEDEPALLCLWSPGQFPTDSAKHVPEICSSEVYGCNPVFCLACSSQDLKLHSPMLTAPRLPLAFTSSSSSSLFVSSCSYLRVSISK